jgi:hypothetical protein
VCNRTASQDRDSAVPDSDDCGLDAVFCRSGVDDQWHPSVEFIQDMLCCCRTDASESVCARGSERLIQFTHDFSKHTMCAESHRHGIQSCGNNIRNQFALRQNHRERPRPKLIGQFRNQLPIIDRKCGNSFQPLAIRQVNNERIEARPVLRFKNLGDGNRVERVSGESVNSFGRQRNKIAFSQQFNRRNAVG